MMDALMDFTRVLLCGAGLTIQFGVAGIAVLLVLRSLGIAFLPIRSHRHVRPLVRLTERIVTPARQALPSVLRDRRIDYSPLLTAVYLLAFGYGLSHFFFQILTVF